MDFETEVLVLDNASQDGSVDVAAPPPGDDRRDRAPRAPRQGRQRLRAAAARARPLLPAAQRGLRARAGRDRRAARRARVRPAGRRGRRDARPPRRRAAAVRVALPVPGHGAADRAVAASLARRPEPRRGGAAGRLGAVGGDARAARGGGADRLLRPGLLRLLRRGRLLPPARRRRLAHALRARRARRPPRAARRPARVPSRRIVEFSRNRDKYMRKHHTAVLGMDRALADGVDLRLAGRRRARAPRPQREALLQARQRDAVPAPRRGPGRGRRGVQPEAAAHA